MRSSSLLLYSFIHFIQFVLSIAVAGLYGRDLAESQKPEGYAGSKWVYAVVVAGLSAVMSVGHLPQLLKGSWIWPVCDFIFVFLWTIVLGLFAHLFINRDVSGHGVQRMKNAVLLDLTNLLLWFVTFLLNGTAYHYNWRRRRSRDGDQSSDISEI